MNLEKLCSRLFLMLHGKRCKWKYSGLFLLFLLSTDQAVANQILCFRAVWRRNNCSANSGSFTGDDHVIAWRGGTTLQKRKSRQICCFDHCSSTSAFLKTSVYHCCLNELFHPLKTVIITRPHWWLQDCFGYLRPQRRQRTALLF